MAGAAGVAFGTNIWTHPNPRAMTAAIASVIHGGASVDEALEHVETHANLARGDQAVRDGERNVTNRVRPVATGAAGEAIGDERRFRDWLLGARWTGPMTSSPLRDRRLAIGV